MYVICSILHDEEWVRSDGKHHGDIDIAIAVEHLCLAATEQGLATCWVCNQTLTRHRKLQTDWQRLLHMGHINTPSPGEHRTSVRRWLMFLNKHLRSDCLCALPQQDKVPTLEDVDCHRKRFLCHPVCRSNKCHLVSLFQIRWLNNLFTLTHLYIISSLIFLIHCLTGIPMKNL